MNSIAIVMFAFVAIASVSAAIRPGLPIGIVPKAVSLGGDATAEVLRSESVVDPEKFHYAYETSNGISAQADGQLKQFAKPEEPALTQQGSYSYTAPDGTIIKVDYVADENGYQPSGAHLPVSPPIPEPIARALEWIAAHPYTGP